MPERGASGDTRLAELRAEIDAAGSDIGRLAAVVRALAREEVDDPGEVRELLRWSRAASGAKR